MTTIRLVLMTAGLLGFVAAACGCGWECLAGGVSLLSAGFVLGLLADDEDDDETPLERRLREFTTEQNGEGRR